MQALTAKAALVDPATLEAEGGSAITTRIPRSEVEDAVRAGGASDLFLDIERVRDEREHREVEAQQRITISWDPDDLEGLLASSTGDEVTFAFKPEELARLLDEPEVEAQGLRERVAILTVAAATAAGISAGVAGAQVMAGDQSGGSGQATAGYVTGGATGSGLPHGVAYSGSDAEQSTQPVTASGGGQSFIESKGGEAVLAGGLALLIVGAGFVGVRQRRGIQPA